VREDGAGGGERVQQLAVPLPQRLLQCLGVQGPGFRVQSSGFRVQGSGSRVQSSGLRVQSSGFRVQIPGSRVQGSGSSAPAPQERAFFIDNPVVRLHPIIEMTLVDRRYGTLKSLFQVACYLPSSTKGSNFRVHPDQSHVQTRYATIVRVHTCAKVGVHKCARYSHSTPQRACRDKEAFVCRA